MWRIVVFCLLLSFPAVADGDLELVYTDENRPTAGSYYHIQGYNPTSSPQIVVIKITDKPEPAYHDRVNEERWVLPGAFEIWVQPSALQTPNGKFLALNGLDSLTVFSPADLDFESIVKTEIQPPSDVLAYDFGPIDSPIFLGFERLGPQSSHIKSINVQPFIRKGGDSLIRDGLKGITLLEIPISNGLWRASLWTEDIGGWETLPPLYERRIRINGQDVDLLRQNHHQWIRSRYLQGQRANQETPWVSFGSRRGDLRQFEVNVNNGLFKLELAGSNLQATTITGLILEPLGFDYASVVQEQRKKWFDQRWPYIVEERQINAVKEIVVFAGETIFVPSDNQELISVTGIDVKAYYPQQAFHRSQPNSGMLVRQSRRFSTQVSKSETSIYQIRILKNVKTGIYDLGGLKVHVVEQALPDIPKSIGIYLEPALYLRDEAEINRQIWCDLEYLSSLGLTAIAPPFSDNIVADYNRAIAFGYRDILAYTPMKRHHAAVKRAIQTGLINDLYLSIADEPSNLGTGRHISDLHDFLQNESPFAKKAGHFNSRKDWNYLKFVDLALINAGFGVDIAQIMELKKVQNRIWFYNMEDTRLGSGFYMWRADVDGYLQWHGRMPTADPFDPTDGREDDVQMLYPSKTACLQHPDIDINLIDMVNGISDLRWLKWLDGAAKQNREARKLRDEIHTDIPLKWQDARKVQRGKWQSFKSQIQELAFRLQ
ncbi:hypothetical protein [Curvivirga sp.]|uniref:hypothetical protein n=1 Tax=Curvivirga sp. TaxID=2856848 RepID=UPI003B5BD1D0